MSISHETRKRLWQIILDHFRSGKPQPSIRGLMQLLKTTSPSVVQHHLKALKKEGLIQIDGCKTRTLRLLKGIGIPVLGNVAAGVPLDNFDNPAEEILIPAQAFGMKSPDLYALHVHGDSMIGANIQDGDYAIIHKQAHVEDGEIAAVLIDGQGTLKRVHHTQTHTELRSENPKYSPILLSENKSNVLFGKMVGLFRVCGR